MSKSRRKRYRPSGPPVPVRPDLLPRERQRQKAALIYPVLALGIALVLELAINHF